MKALTLHQPWASLVALGVKTIETRSWSTKYRGPLAIHAGAKPIGSGALYLGDGRRGWTNVTGEPIAEGQQMMSGGIDDLLVCPLGAIVATCTLVDVVPMVDAGGCKDATKHLCIVNESMLLHSELNKPWPDGHTEHVVSDQRPYGDFRPGRYAWLLDDVKPTTERCPACWGSGERFTVTGAQVVCVCGDAGTCPPIPARGRPRLWEWTPNRNRGEER